MFRFENTASPRTAATVVVPERVASAGFVLMRIVTSPVKLASVCPNASCAVTLTAGAIAALAKASAG